MASGTIKLLTLNIAHGRGPILHQGLVKQKTILKWMGKIVELLNDLQPDIVALQEIDEDSQWNGNLDLLEFLRSKPVSNLPLTECTISIMANTVSSTAMPFSPDSPSSQMKWLLSIKRRLGPRDSSIAVAKLH